MTGRTETVYQGEQITVVTRDETGRDVATLFTAIMRKERIVPLTKTGCQDAMRDLSRLAAEAQMALDMVAVVMLGLED